jgi:mono/diheme cytochrome c family protein
MIASLSALIPTIADVFADELAMSSGSAHLARGKYLTVIAGCNDCHTPGYADAGGNAPVERWLTGDQLGFRGPWGTTYAPNLRLYFQAISEDQWVSIAKAIKTRPPMPWYSINAMSEDDLRAIHKFVRSLGAAGVPAPQALPPGEEPKTPTLDWPTNH